MAYLWLSFAIVCEVVGTTALKLSDGFTRPGPAMVTVLGYGAAFYLLSLTLRTLSVGFTYAVWSGAGIVLIALIGVTFLGERADPAGIVGMGLIVAGVVVLQGFSRMAG